MDKKVFTILYSKMLFNWTYDNVNSDLVSEQNNTKSQKQYEKQFSLKTK